MKRLVAKWIGTRKRLFSGSFTPRVRLERGNNFFPRHIVLINPYIHICPYSWALGICNKIGIRTYFASVAAESVGFFRHFCVLARNVQTCHFFYHKLHQRTFFEAHLLSPLKIWQLWTLKSYKVLMESPYTIVTVAP